VTEKLLLEFEAPDSCFYFHENHASSAIINVRQQNELVSNNI